MHIVKLIFTSILVAGSLSVAQTTENMSIFKKSQKLDTDGTELYGSNTEMRGHKKFGAGTSIGGSGGMLGLNLETNLEPENALVIGVGTGPSYGTFNILWKNSIESRYLSPYTKVGYSKWFAAGGSGTAADSGTLRQIFSDHDLRAGKFGADFLVGSVGAEYNQLEGEMAGVNFYGELVLMGEMRTAKLIPSGAIGITYFY